MDFMSTFQHDDASLGMIVSFSCESYHLSYFIL